MIVWNDSERSTSGSRLSSTLAVSSVDTNESLSLALGLGDGGGSVTMAMSVVTCSCLRMISFRAWLLSLMIGSLSDKEESVSSVSS